MEDPYINRGSSNQWGRGGEKTTTMGEYIESNAGIAPAT